MKYFIVLFLFLSVACQQQPKPTVGVTEGGVLLQDRDYRKVIQENAVLFDARSPFEFNTNRVPGSINLIPSDFVVERDPLDAARRLSLYGVSPETPVVVLGDGSGDNIKIAWEFAQLGLKEIETLNIQVFRTLNVRAEAPPKNAVIWKPEVRHKQITFQDFQKEIKNAIPRPTSGARVSALQSSGAAQALQDRILIVQVEGQQITLEKFTYVFERLFEKNIELFDSRGLLKSNKEWHDYLNRFDRVYLIDKSDQRWARAFALTRWGAKSLTLVRP